MRVSKESIMEQYIICDECGYNNKKDRFEAFGTCLRCGKVLDERIHFKAMMIREALKRGRIKGGRVNRRICHFR